ncbi:CPBP family intramembrane glutamic endopeptidase [Aeromonas salmonicida]|uniref:CPBP family intramembrane glutamic endopeptidase n=1 Tax=Aeromonas salmonicida TaxID=645 RepID=UPI0024A97752|nr:CPBP family intramembrane glutamic endopeptidase [Aeromonas salmonicida]MDM5136379.1 CPBP family intramembrane metalloprotease [Aeromonas salmonicida]WHF40843.1 CPBP family intramembrane metalloprotease [Aeromonas salmonicida]
MREHKSAAIPVLNDSDYYGFERKSAGDFPFYREGLHVLSARRWVLILLGVALGFSMLTVPIAFFKTTLGGFVPAILFPLIPLAVLAMMVGKRWRALFRTPTWRDVLLMVAIVGANILVSFTVAILLQLLFKMNTNPVNTLLAGASDTALILFYLKTAPQLFGEEVVSILPFLAILWFCHTKLSLSRKSAIITAWLCTALIFGALHLPTYEWNFLQCFLVIGTARIVLLSGYIITKNIWVSTGAHIINDWLLFTIMAAFLGANTAG